jgi:glycosyltransferase involved in cell wall biosynthesis
MTPSRPTLICLSAYFPWPADSGGCIRIEGMARSLSQEFEVHLLVPQEHDDATTTMILDKVHNEVDMSIEVFHPRRFHRSRAAAAALWVQSVAKQIPPWIYGDLDAGLMARLVELSDEADGVVLLQDFMGMYPLLAPKPVTIPVIADKHVVLARPRTEQENTLRVRLLRRLTASYEKRYLATADRVVVTTDEDGRWLQKLYGREPSAIIPTGVPLGPPRTSRIAPRHRVGWLSALDVEDNRLGLAWFLEDGWPRLAEQGCELLVAGRNPNPEVWDMVSIPGVRFLGHVDSLEMFFADIDVAVIPLWSGRGIKVKTLTFMGEGIPVAATPMAVEGMQVEHGRHCLIGQTPQALAEHVRRLLDDRDHADSIAAAGRQLIADHFTWEAVGEQFNAVVRDTLTPRP